MDKQKLEIDTINKDVEIETSILYYDSSNYVHNQFYKRLSFINNLSYSGITTPMKETDFNFEVFVNKFFNNALTIKEARVYVNDVLIKKYENCANLDYGIEIIRAYNPSSIAVDQKGIGTVESLKIILS